MNPVGMIILRIFITSLLLKLKPFFDPKLDDSQAGKLVLIPEDKESSKKLARLEIYRVLIKKAVMTIPYNASTSSIIEYIKENSDKKREKSLLF